MEHKNFAAFILTHGRANTCITDKTLRKQGYRGKIYYVIDDEDEQAEQYKKNFGDSVIQFCKAEYLKKSDTMDLDGPRGIVLPARNATFDIAKNLGLEYFLMLDDDYVDFEFRYPHWKKDKQLELKGYSIKNLESVFDGFLDWLDATGALTIAFAQGGGFDWRG